MQLLNDILSPPSLNAIQLILLCVDPDTTTVLKCLNDQPIIFVLKCSNDQQIKGKKRNSKEITGNGRNSKEITGNP